MSETSRRQELLEYVETGRLRDDITAYLSQEAADLCVDIVLRYCESRRKVKRARA